jgi:uncharacterized BrkB/YihY/UPF0761 family membrane protein
VLRSGVEAAWLTIKRSLITIYNDAYDEHLFVFAAGLSYYFVLSLQAPVQRIPCFRHLSQDESSS